METRQNKTKAPSTGRPVVVNVGVLWRFQVKPTPPRPPRLPVGVTVGCVILTLVRVIFGVVYFKDCPQQPNIPNYLLGLALIPLLMIPFVTLPCESQAAQPQGPPRGFKACLGCLMALFIFTWILAGDVWVFSVYQPSYDPTAADGLYCDKTLYTFALWNAVWETFALWFNLAKLCKGLLCWVVMSPAPANRDVYGHV
ncbi:transmembrane protein 272-like isoform X1 [Acanthopagrus latus]|uniref:transmembrane protein 272-like isoform X1 n=1 Tax=Acanthopagrus latus TaxID=8177 RepID=UPI00187C00FB|nr:transmembrane protein 272-like isoform X1 [Acanthopagrus latus]